VSFLWRIIPAKGLLVEFLLIVLSGYIVYALTLFAFQRRMIYPGCTIKPEHFIFQPHNKPEMHWIETKCGKTELWYFAAVARKDSIPAGFTIFFAHGNNELIDYCLDEAQALANLGYNILLPEFPGYGRSGGNPSQKTIIATMVAAYDWLQQEKGARASQIIYYGRSLGGGVVCALSMERPARAMILLSTFTSMRRMSARFYVPGCFVLDSFDNEKAIQRFNNPILIFHGKRDDVIPYENGKTLAARSDQARLISYDCGHNDLPPDWPGYFTTLQEFIAGL
jgi:pimeloyl-ACP methyl ester carboxylesterase